MTIPIIAGPCSAESENQILSIAQFLKEKTSVEIMRAGVWKPRTTPGGFEGMGTAALDWLVKAREIYGIKIAVEVASAQHIEECVKRKIDTVWIGARTSVNPFSVQEIAECVTGIDINVWVKNPVNPDLKLWLGAIERIEKAGVKNIVAIHRGFSSANTDQFRNAPMWEIPIEMKRIRRDIPIYCDPSHITGRRDAIKNFAQRAIDMETDGLMIEIHNNPDNALTDKNQQLNFNEFEDLLTSLVARVSCRVPKLEQLRLLIDDIDGEMITVLSRRMKIIKEMGECKRENNMSMLQLDRWISLLKNRLETGKRNGLNEDFIREIMNVIHLESIRIQE